MGRGGEGHVTQGSMFKAALTEGRVSLFGLLNYCIKTALSRVENCYFIVPFFSLVKCVRGDLQWKTKSVYKIVNGD